MQKFALVIEKSDQKLWGRVTVNGNLITDEANTVEELESNIRQLVNDFEEISDFEFERQFDVYALFEQFDFLNISKVAGHAGINAGLLRQYASGVKHPSANQAKKIEDTIHSLATQMQKIAVYAE